MGNIKLYWYLCASSKLLISDHWIGLDKVYVFVLIEEIKMVATFEYRSKNLLKPIIEHALRYGVYGENLLNKYYQTVETHTLHDDHCIVLLKWHVCTCNIWLWWWPPLSQLNKGLHFFCFPIVWAISGC